MDDDHPITAVRYVSLNPVRSRLVLRAEECPRANTRAHLAGRNDELVQVAPVLSRVADFASLIAPDARDKEAIARLRASEETGRPVGNADFIASLERILGRSVGRSIARRVPGRKPKSADDDAPRWL